MPLSSRNCLHMPGFVLHQEVPSAHCISIKHDNMYFILMPHSSQGTTGYDMAKDMSPHTITDPPPNKSCSMTGMPNVHYSVCQTISHLSHVHVSCEPAVKGSGYQWPSALCSTIVCNPSVFNHIIINKKL